MNLVCTNCGTEISNEAINFIIASGNNHVRRKVLRTKKAENVMMVQIQDYHDVVCPECGTRTFLPNLTEV